MTSLATPTPERKTRTYIPASVALTGRPVTTRCKLGGIGLAHLVDGRTWQSGGNGFYYETEADAEMIDDNGDGYREAIHRICGGAS